MVSEFELDPQLGNDSLKITDLPLSELRLSKDSNYPWVILIPRRAGIREIYQLSKTDQHQLWQESAQVGQAMMNEFGGEKLNVAALGNVVAQLHVHHVVRFSDDIAWPNPVWGAHPSKPYMNEESAQIIERIRRRLQL